MSAWREPLGLYRPGTSFLHRAPAAWKLLGLSALGLAGAALRGLPSAVGLVTVVVVLAAVAHLPVRRTVRGLVPVALGGMLVVAFHAFGGRLESGLEIALDLLALVLAALVLTATTAVDRVLDLLERVVRPLRRLGLDPEAFALAVALMVRAVPALGETVEQSRDAARARGLERSPRALLVPVAIRAVGRAQATGDALAARGVGEQAR